MLPAGKVFGKNTGATGEDDFSQKPQGPTLPADEKHPLPLPGSSSGRVWSDCSLRFLFLKLFILSVSPANKKSRLPRAALCTGRLPALQHLYVRFIILPSEYQKTQYGRQYCNRYDQAGYHIYEAEKTFAEHDGYGSPYRRYSARV